MSPTGSATKMRSPSCSTSSVGLEQHRGAVLVRLDASPGCQPSACRDRQRPLPAEALVVLQAVGIGRHESIGHFNDLPLSRLRRRLAVEHSRARRGRLGERPRAAGRRRDRPSGARPTPTTGRSRAGRSPWRTSTVRPDDLDGVLGLEGALHARRRPPAAATCPARRPRAGLRRRRRSARPGRSAKAIQSLRAPSVRRCGRKIVPTPGSPGDGLGEHGRAAGPTAITTREPDQAAILAAASLEDMPPRLDRCWRHRRRPARARGRSRSPPRSGSPRRPGADRR